MARWYMTEKLHECVEKCNEVCWFDTGHKGSLRGLMSVKMMWITGTTSQPRLTPMGNSVAHHQTKTQWANLFSKDCVHPCIHRLWTWGRRGWRVTHRMFEPSFWCWISHSGETNWLTEKIKRPLETGRIDNNYGVPLTPTSIQNSSVFPVTSHTTNHTDSKRKPPLKTCIVSKVQWPLARSSVLAGVKTAVWADSESVIKTSESCKKRGF